MPKPIYMICCESGAEDKFTGLASHFNVVDRVVAKQFANSDAGGSIYVNSVPLQIVAVWRAEDSDFEASYQLEMSMMFLPRQQPVTLLSQDFRFLQNKPKHRVTVNIAGFTAGESGQIVFESRVRREGQSEWLAQSYTIDVIVHPPDDSRPAPDEPDASAKGLQ